METTLLWTQLCTMPKTARPTESKSSLPRSQTKVQRPSTTGLLSKKAQEVNLNQNTLMYWRATFNRMTLGTCYPTTPKLSAAHHSSSLPMCETVAAKCSPTSTTGKSSTHEPHRLPRTSTAATSLFCEHERHRGSSLEVLGKARTDQATLVALRF